MTPVLAAAAADAEGVAAAAAHGARWVALAAGALQSRPPGEGGDLAASCGVFLLTARTAPPPAGPGGAAPASAVLWSPGGHAVARQSSVLAGGSDLDPVMVDGWPCGILVGDDARSPELARVLQLRGALCLWCTPAPNRSPDRWHALAGVWQLVQQTQCFALEACLPPGRCAVHAPCELTPGETGFLALAADPDASPNDAASGPLRGAPRPAGAPGPVLGRLDAEALDRLRGMYDLRRQLNPALYRRYMPGIHEGDAP